MKRLLTLILCSLCTVAAACEERDSLLLVFQNLENFFDFKDDGTGTSDRDFTPGGSRRWTKRRFYIKCNAVAKTILWAGGGIGREPDIVAMAEIENAFVLRSLLRCTPLRKFSYLPVHFDSPDHRGIDVALIYRKDRLELLRSRPVRIDSFATRDILLSVFKTYRNDTIAVLVNHHPSKFGGEKASRPGRMMVMGKMLSVCDSLLHSGIENIIAAGDFNDTPDGEAFTLPEGRLANKGIPIHIAGEGTLRYEGKWELIDNFLVSPAIDGLSTMSVLYPPFLLTEDRAHGGFKPLRTYSGPRWLGGISDHLPIRLTVRDAANVSE